MVNKNKKILIIGQTLYSSLLAYHLSFKNYDITLISKTKKLKSFDPINIGNFKLNNGFHGLDLPRGNAFLKFLKKIGVPMLKEKKINQVLIDRYILNLYEKINNWPRKYQNNFKYNFKIKKNFVYENFLKGNLLKNFKICSSRFSNDYQDCKYLLVPWFLPKEYKFSSIDEGARFREKIKNNSITNSYAKPKNNLFNSIQDKINLVLSKRKNIRILTFSKINFENQKIEFSKNLKKNDIFFKEFSKIYYGENFISLLKYFKTSHLKKISKNKRFFFNALILLNKKLNFTEMICLNKNIYNLNRISVFKKIKNKTFIQLEIFDKKPELSKIKINKITKEITKIFLLDKKPLLIGYKFSRILYASNINWKKNAISIIKKWLLRNNIKISVNYKFDGPINMNKSWLYSMDEVEKL